MPAPHHRAAPWGPEGEGEVRGGANDNNDDIVLFTTKNNTIIRRSGRYAVTTSIRVDPEVARAFKIRCHLLHRSMSEVIEALMARFLEETGGQRTLEEYAPRPSGPEVKVQVNQFYAITIQAQLTEAKLALQEALRVLERAEDEGLRREYLRKLAKAVPKGSFLWERTGDEELAGLLERARRWLK